MFVSSNPSADKKMEMEITHHNPTEKKYIVKKVWPHLQKNILKNLPVSKMKKSKSVWFATSPGKLDSMNGFHFST